MITRFVTILSLFLLMDVHLIAKSFQDGSVLQYFHVTFSVVILILTLTKLVTLDQTVISDVSNVLNNQAINVMAHLVQQSAEIQSKLDLRNVITGMPVKMMDVMINA